MEGNHIWVYFAYGRGFVGDGSDRVTQISHYDSINDQIGDIFKNRQQLKPEKSGRRAQKADGPCLKPVIMEH